MKNLFLLLLSSCISYQSITQAVGIGTTAPDASAILHVDAGTSTSKGLLVTGTYTQGVIASLPDLGAGSRMMFYPGKAAFRAGYVYATEWDNANVGYFSTATGSGTTARGIYSTAMGAGTTASGTYSTATGFSTTASGNYSNTSGFSTTAGGTLSTATGEFTKAKGFASTVAGMFNDSLLAINETVVSATTPLFIVGNGDADNNRSNAVVIQKNGNMGIGNSLPNVNALLHVNTGESLSKGLLVTGIYNFSSTVPNLGAGSRMMYYPGKAAFRAGSVTGTQWNDANVGSYSTATGSNTIASGSYSTAMGSGSHATGDYSTAFGFQTIARGFFSLAAGYQTTGGGNNTASFGVSTEAKGYASTVIGMYNDPLLITDEYSVTSGTPLFIVGNGDASYLRSNALVVRKNGNSECNANLTVQNGKGIIRNTDGTQSKKLSATTLVNVGLDALGTKTVGVTWPEAFSAAPEAYVGNITSGGGWAEVILSVAEVTSTGAVLYVSNPRGSTLSPNFTVKIIAIGPQ